MCPGWKAPGARSASTSFSEGMAVSEVRASETRASVAGRAGRGCTSSSGSTTKAMRVSSPKTWLTVASRTSDMGRCCKNSRVTSLGTAISRVVPISPRGSHTAMLPRPRPVTWGFSFMMRTHSAHCSSKVWLSCCMNDS